MNYIENYTHIQHDNQHRTVTSVKIETPVAVKHVEKITECANNITERKGNFIDIYV